MRLGILLLLAPTVVMVAGGAITNYKLDRKTPAGLVFTYPNGPVPPGRVDIYRTGPRIWIDDLDSFISLSRQAADYSVTNHTEIKELVSVLRHADKEARIPDATRRQGYTYHLLMLNDEKKTVMHFRVFEPTDTNTTWCVVWPRSETGFSCDNGQIRSWLHSRVKMATNAPPQANEIPANSGVKSASGSGSTTSTNVATRPVPK